MSSLEHPQQNAAEAAQESDPFELPKRIRKHIRKSAQHAEKAPRSIAYLWIHVSKTGIAQSTKKPVHPMPLDMWLNVVDEASTLGVNWLVVTLDTSLSSYPDIWEIAKWAQSTHGMDVGVYAVHPEVTPEVLAAIKKLDLDRFQFIVKRESYDDACHLEKEGIRVVTADPQPYGGKPNCQGAAKMVFVNPEGVLYTCGLVEGNWDYRLGTVFEGKFENLLTDPQLPHSVADQIHRVSCGCDACPSLVANFMARQ